MTPEDEMQAEALRVALGTNGLRPGKSTSADGSLTAVGAEDLDTGQMFAVKIVDGRELEAWRELYNQIKAAREHMGNA